MESTHLQRLGEAVRELRTRAGLTQDRLGSPLVSKSFISQLEKGAVSPSLSTLFHISNRLGVSPARILALADAGTFAAAALDMAEAALIVKSDVLGRTWIEQLETAIPIEHLAQYDLSRRWARYTGLVRLTQGKFDSAIALFESALPDTDPIAQYWLGLTHMRAGYLLQALRTWEALSDMNQRGSRPKNAASRSNAKGSLNQSGRAQRAPDRRSGTEGPSDRHMGTEGLPDRVLAQPSQQNLDLLQAVTWVQLHHLYGLLGDPLEADRARAHMQAAVTASDHPDSNCWTSLRSDPQSAVADPFALDGKWSNAAQFLARLLCAQARQAWDNADIPQASATARLIPILASVTLIPMLGGTRNETSD